MLRRVVPYLDQLLVASGSFLTIAICAHKLTLVEQGKLSYVFALYMATVVMQGTLIHNWATVQFPRRNNHLRYHQSLILISITLAILSSCLLCSVLYLLAYSTDWLVTFKTLLLLLIFLVTQQITDFLRKTAYYTSHQEKAFWISLMMYPLRIVLLLVAIDSQSSFCLDDRLYPICTDLHVNVSVKTVDDVLIISIVSCLVPLLWFVKFPWRSKIYPIKQLIRIGFGHLKGAFPLGVIAVTTWSWNYIPIFFLGALSGTETVALLASIRSLSNMFNVVLEVLETSFAAKFSRAYANTCDWRLLVRKEYISGYTLWFLGFLFLLFMHNAIVPIALGNKYIEYDYLMVIFWVAQSFTFLFRIEGVKLRTQGMPELIAFGHFCALVFVSLVSWFVIKHKGINGASLLYLCAPLLVFVGQYAGYRVRRKAT